MELRGTMECSYVLLAICCCLRVTSQATAVNFKDCGSKLARLEKIDITPCPQMPCPFKRNSNISVTIHFKAGSTIVKAVTEMYGIVEGVYVPFSLPDNNACNFMNCPIKAGEEGTYSNKFFIYPLYPEIELIVLWKIVSEGDNVICFTAPVVVVA